VCQPLHSDWFVEQRKINNNSHNSQHTQQLLLVVDRYFSISLKMLSSLRKAMPMLAMGGSQVVSKVTATTVFFNGCRAMSSFRILRLDNLSHNKGAFKKVS
jgi:hypothetical protein